MPGKVVFLRCHHFDLPMQFQFGADIRFYEHVQEYYRLCGMRRKLKKLNLDEQLEESCSFGMDQCIDCTYIFQAYQMMVTDKSGNVHDFRSQSKCPSCRGKVRTVNEFEESLTSLPCPHCGTKALVEEAGVILWD